VAGRPGAANRGPSRRDGELARYGYSRDGRRGKLQIVLIERIWRSGTMAARVRTSFF
jgi:hypothetical protein